jgi:hypothetical protein
MIDNAGCYKAFAFRNACRDLGPRQSPYATQWNRESCQYAAAGTNRKSRQLNELTAYCWALQAVPPQHGHDGIDQTPGVAVDVHECDRHLVQV